MGFLFSYKSLAILKFLFNLQVIYIIYSLNANWNSWNGDKAH